MILQHYKLKNNLMIQKMNKIETAIERTKIELKKLKNEEMCIKAQIEVIENQLDMLEFTDRNEAIPHQEK